MHLLGSALLDQDQLVGYVREWRFCADWDADSPAIIFYVHVLAPRLIGVLVPKLAEAGTLQRDEPQTLAKLLVQFIGAGSITLGIAIEFSQLGCGGFCASHN
jgi:hypothetical protein